MTLRELIEKYPVSLDVPLYFLPHPEDTIWIAADEATINSSEHETAFDDLGNPVPIGAIMLLPVCP